MARNPFKVYTLSSGFLERLWGEIPTFGPKGSSSWREVLCVYLLYRSKMGTLFELTKENIAVVPKSSGIYKIYASFSFPRLHGETNILYIGKAKNLRRRLGTFIRGRGRNALPRFQRLQKNGFCLMFSYKPCDDPKLQEVLSLTKYERKHLELPPLNHSS